MFERYREVLAAHGLRYAPATCVLMCMCEYPMDYWEALAAYADMKGLPVEPLHASMCYEMLGARVETPAPRWFAELVKEVEEREYEDGLYAEEGN